MNTMAALVFFLQQNGLTEDEFRKLHQELAAGKKTACGIPWEFTIREGRERALKEGKPLFIYALGGDFLGNG